MEGKNVIKVCQHVKEVTKMKQRQLRLLDKKLLRIIKRYWSSDTIVTGNERITSEWKMPNELFQLKKQMLLQNIEVILDEFIIVKRENDKEMTSNVPSQSSDIRYEQRGLKPTLRRNFLLVLNSTEWSYKEVEAILWRVQRRYEDIYIVTNKCAFFIEDISDYFLEECGVILHILEEKVAKQMRFHTIFFLLEHCDNRGKDYLFQNKYQLVEWEENQFQSLLFVAQNDTINNGMRKNC